VNRQIFIMAQGAGSRWEIDKHNNWYPPADYKQLVPIGDETIITRTIRQFTPNEMAVIAHGDVFYPVILNKAYIMTFQGDVGTIIRGLWMTNEFWREDQQIVFLLGDVVFSNDLVEQILSKEHYTTATIFGRTGSNPVTRKRAKEIFALVIPSGAESHNFWRQEFRSFWVNHFGEKLWDFYSINYPELDFVEINDYSDDVDSPQEYQQFYPRLQEATVNDDAKLR